MLRIKGNITHQSRNSHLILNFGRKSAIKPVFEDKRKIPHRVSGVVQSSIRIKIWKQYLETRRDRRSEKILRAVHGLLNNPAPYLKASYAEPRSCTS